MSVCGGGSQDATGIDSGVMAVKRGREREREKRGGRGVGTNEIAFPPTAATGTPQPSEDAATAIQASIKASGA